MMMITIACSYWFIYLLIYKKGDNVFFQGFDDAVVIDIF